MSICWLLPRESPVNVNDFVEKGSDVEVVIVDEVPNSVENVATLMSGQHTTADYVGYIAGRAAHSLTAWKAPQLGINNQTPRLRRLICGYNAEGPIFDNDYFICPRQLLPRLGELLNRLPQAKADEVEYIFTTSENPQYDYTLADDPALIRNVFESIVRHHCRSQLIYQFYQRFCWHPPANLPLVLVLDFLLDCYINIFFVDRAEATYLAQLLSFIFKQRADLAGSVKFPPANVQQNFNYVGVNLDQPNVEPLTLADHRPQLYRWLVQRINTDSQESLPAQPLISWLVDDPTKVSATALERDDVHQAEEVDEQTKLGSCYVGYVDEADEHFWNDDFQRRLAGQLTGPPCRLEYQLPGCRIHIEPHHYSTTTINRDLFQNWGELSSYAEKDPACLEQLFRHKRLTLSQGLHLLRYHDSDNYKRLLNDYPTLIPLPEGYLAHHWSIDRVGWSKGKGKDYPDYIVPWLSQHIPQTLLSTEMDRGMDNLFSAPSQAKWGIVVFATLTKDNYRRQLLACLNSWLTDAENMDIPYYVFIGDQSPKPDKPANVSSEAWSRVICLPYTGEDYFSATSKQYGGLEWMTRYCLCDYYFFVGTDNYVSVPSLDELIRQQENKEILIGQVIGTTKLFTSTNYTPNFPYLSGGPGIIAGRQALQRMSEGQRLRQLGEVDWPRLTKQPGHNNKLVPLCDVSIGYYASEAGIPLATYPGFYGARQHLPHLFRVNQPFYSFHEMPPPRVNFFGLCSRSLEEWYDWARTTPSDIYKHLPTLLRYANECDTLVECGVRSVVSSWAFALSVKQGKSKELISCDLNAVAEVVRLAEVCRREGVPFHFLTGSDLEVDIPETDLLFIDTWHIYGHLRRELAKLAPLTRKYIIMHDTTVDAERGEVLRLKQNVDQACKRSGYSRKDVTTGLRLAVDEFLAANQEEWEVAEVFTNNNGLTVLKRIGRA